MQTFLPYPDFYKSAACLDNKRLGKQRVEAKQIWLALQPDSTSKWQNHPAVKMWRDYENSLAFYGIIICREWKSRGHKDSLEEWFLNIFNYPIIYPLWFGDKEFHESHQSNLVRKKPEYYRFFFPDVPEDLPYVWPV